ncbi:MAG: hypothetical protein IJ844_07800 [Prevotella sp.]|nr:hypothetical protein [Prevotella sp.]
MNTKNYLLIVATITFIVACNNNADNTTIDGKVKKAFVEWSNDNLPKKATVKTVSYDTVGCPMDFMYKATMLGQMVGSSGHAESEINIGNGLIAIDCILDSTMLGTNILIANVNVKIKDSLYTYYVGMRGDSICTTPQEHEYEALIKTHTEGEQRLYDACYEIFCNLKYAVKKTGIGMSTSMKDYYNFWLFLPSYEEALSRTRYNSMLNSHSL